MLSELITILARRAEDAGFHEASTQQYLNAGNLNWSDGALQGELGYWESSFASILLVDITTEQSVEAQRQAKFAETFLDSAIVQRERSGLVIDGYLVLAATQVTEEFQAFILDIERDVRFVRKHVVTWGANGWERYERITPLGLERLEVNGEPPAFASEEVDYHHLLELLVEVGSAELAERHGKEWNLNE